jgi:uncharacterized membrane protein
MMKRLFDLANATLLFLTALFVYAWYAKLPARFPSHFDLAGNPDRWSGKGAFLIIVAFPFILTVVFYVLIRFMPRLAGNPRRLNIPHKEEFLKLPAEKQMVYWALLQEFFAGLMAAINLLFYLIVRGTVRVAAGEASLLPLSAMLPALAAMALLMLYYFRRMFTLPGKLVRGEE